MISFCQKEINVDMLIEINDHDSYICAVCSHTQSILCHCYKNNQMPFCWTQESKGFLIVESKVCLRTEHFCADKNAVP